jgi:hypothetical protein
LLRLHFEVFLLFLSSAVNAAWLIIIIYIS